MIIGNMYRIVYYDHFEGDMSELIITELGFYIGETDKYMYFCGYRDSAGHEYNRSGVMKNSIKDLEELHE